MHGHVALLRGVNLGGGNKVPMADLRALATSLGWRDVQSLIASGNLVFRAEGSPDVLAAALRTAMVSTMGVDVPVVVIPGATFQQALTACPFDPAQGKDVHVFFLFADPVVEWTAFATYRAPGEELAVEGRLAFLHTPMGFGRSKLVEKLPKVVTSTDMTGRNLNTVRKLALMLEALPGSPP